MDIFLGILLLLSYFLIMYLVISNAYRLSIFYRKIIKNIGIKKERLFVILVIASGFIYLFITPTKFDFGFIEPMLYTALGLFLIDESVRRSIKKHLQYEKDVEIMKKKRESNDDKNSKKVVLINPNRENLKKLSKEEWAGKIAKEVINNLKN